MAVLLSSKMWPAWRDVKGLWCMRTRTHKQPQVKKEPCRVLDDADVDVELSHQMMNTHWNQADQLTLYKRSREVELETTRSK